MHLNIGRKSQSPATHDDTRFVLAQLEHAQRLDPLAAGRGDVSKSSLRERLAKARGKAR